jgi:hypothetical protein
MLQQPLQAASTTIQLPQLRRPSAYMVCPSRQAALLPKPASSPVRPCRTSVHVAFLVMFHSSPLRLVTRSPAAGSLPQLWLPLPPLVRPLSCQRCPISSCFLSLPSHIYKLNPTVLSFSAYPALACTLLQVFRRIASRSPALQPSSSFIVLLFPAQIVDIVANIESCF